MVDDDAKARYPAGSKIGFGSETVYAHCKQGASDYIEKDINRQLFYAFFCWFLFHTFSNPLKHRVADILTDIGQVCVAGKLKFYASQFRIPKLERTVYIEKSGCFN